MDCGNIVKFKNCKIMRDHTIFKEDLWVRDGKIIDPEKVFFDEKKSAGLVIDIGGNLIAPGFIDTQINGGFGYDFSYDIDRIDEGLGVVSKGILAHGVTAFCPTLVTSKQETYYKILPRLKKRAGGEHGAEVLGAHIEGPFISKEKKGAHSIDDIQDITNGIDSLIKVYGSLENIRIITLAPEKTLNSDVISKLVEDEITVSLGHSTADIKTGELAVQQGASLITHLFNAMLPFHHRDPGLVGLLASNRIPSIHYGIIADGVHTHPTTLRIAHRANPEGLVLVTDAISAMGLAEGVHHLGEKQIDVRGDHAYIANTTTLCGSVATMSKCVKYFKAAASCSLVEALEAASLHPAKALNIHHKKGTLNYNSDADFVVLNDNLDVVSTWIAGKNVYSAH